MLVRSDRVVKLSKALSISGWVACLWSIGWCFWSSSHVSHKDYMYDPLDAAQYAAWAPLLWSISLTWIIFISYTKNCGMRFCPSK